MLLLERAPTIELGVGVLTAIKLLHTMSWAFVATSILALHLVVLPT
jgi:hypothetical protein